MKREHTQFQPRQGKQNIFRTASGSNENLILNIILGLLAGITKYPSYISEVWLRRRFGERYFSFTVSVVLTLIIFWIMNNLPYSIKNEMGNGWKIFMILFLLQSLRHRLEIRKLGTQFNFDRNSYSYGQIFPFWWQLIGQKKLGIRVSRYMVHVCLEPSIPVILGFLLAYIPFFRGMGLILLISGICFAIRNFIAVQGIRNHILDINDEYLARKWKHEILFEEIPMENEHGLNLPIDLPKRDDIRQAISDSMDEDTNTKHIWDRREKPNNLGNQPVPA